MERNSGKNKENCWGFKSSSVTLPMKHQIYGNLITESEDNSGWDPLRLDHDTAVHSMVGK